MDNLTHSLAGAVLGQMGLKTKTGLAIPTLIIAANIPDIDAVATLLGGHQHLAIRRGITHGPIALVILPLILWGIMLWFDRWQEMRGKRPKNRLPVHKGWLLALAYIGCLSHPAMDWLNVYGIRLLEPFSSQWFYGDTLFIIDIWIWAALIIGVWFSLRRERGGQGNWQRPAWISFTAVCAYIFANGVITGTAERQLARILKDDGKRATMVVASPVPVAFWQREMLWRDGKFGGKGIFSPFYGIGIDPHGGGDVINDAEEKRLALMNSDAEAYLFWSRMPGKFDMGEAIVVTDQRFDNPLVGDRFSLKIQKE